MGRLRFWWARSGKVLEVFGRRSVRRLERWATRERRAQEQGRRTLALSGEYLAACVRGDDARMDAAVMRLNPGALNLAVNELAQRAIRALAAERGATTDAVVRSLIEASEASEAAGTPDECPAGCGERFAAHG